MLAESSEGFTGAEIEQAIVSALYSAKSNKQKPDAAHVLTAIHNTVPISVTRAEDIHHLRRWAQERTVLAN